MSKITVAGVRQNVQQLLDYSNNEKKRNFLETVELQIGKKSTGIPLHSSQKLTGFLQASRITIHSVTSDSRKSLMKIVAADFSKVLTRTYSGTVRLPQIPRPGMSIW